MYAHLVLAWWKYWQCFGDIRTKCFWSSDALMYKDLTSSNVGSLERPSMTNALGWYCPRLPSAIDTFETNVCIKEAYASMTGIRGTRRCCWTRTAQFTMLPTNGDTSHGKPINNSGKGHWATIDCSSNPCSFRRTKESLTPRSKTGRSSVMDKGTLWNPMSEAVRIISW